MARCGIEFPEDFLKKLERLGANNEEITKQALVEGSEIITEQLQKNLRSHDETGELSRSVKPTKPKSFGKSTGAYYTVIRPTGKSNKYIVRGKVYSRKKTVRNMEKLAAIEYGVRGKQAAQPVLVRTLNSCKSAVEQKMDSVMTEAIEQL